MLLDKNKLTGKKVIGIDIFIPKEIKHNLNKHKKINKNSLRNLNYKLLQ